MPKESILVHFCQVKYSKLRRVRWKVGGPPHTPLSWSKLDQTSFRNCLVQFGPTQWWVWCTPTFPLVPLDFEYLALTQVYFLLVPTVTHYTCMYRSNEGCCTLTSQMHTKLGSDLLCILAWRSNHMLKQRYSWILTDSFFLFFSRGNSKLEEATELYVRSANTFKMAKKWGGKIDKVIVIKSIPESSLRQSKLMVFATLHDLISSPPPKKKVLPYTKKLICLYYIEGSMMWVF